MTAYLVSREKYVINIEEHRDEFSAWPGSNDIKLVSLISDNVAVSE